MFIGLSIVVVLDILMWDNVYMGLIKIMKEWMHKISRKG